nr:immunoglobulin heavy chain junction region [Macaca mulatta]MOY22275.1 immunoglobulin heavy chain junction region [Macaca mulatta]MOY28418.1 immunoglobulin heavy chain junction region [Macaca mulatta]MOY29344.1 immunoglobulin heavy chain junction region [Macaca mulatta]
CARAGDSQFDYW